MKILISNDDGVQAPGLHALAAALRRLGEVSICAPEGPRSAASSALTLHKPLIVQEVSKRCWTLNGTPADAVKLALHELLDGPPDIVVSGINNGLNTGSNVVYSGTVAAALEGAQYGITSFAVSRKAALSEDFRSEAKVAAGLIARLAARYPRTPTVFNINLPTGKPRGVEVTATEMTPYDDVYDRRRDPRGRTYFWLRGTPPRNVQRDGQATDDWAVGRGFVSVTPLRRDLTDPILLGDLSRLLHKAPRR